MRLFVAVWPPAPLVERLAALERPESSSLRWTRSDRWHVTLRFLGEVAPDDVASLTSAVRSCAAGLSPATVTAGSETGAFGRRVLHVPVDGLAPWAAAVGEATRGFGSAPEEDADRPFHGHITLARARPRRGAPMPVLALPPGPSAWTATSLSLVHSVAGGGYDDLVACPVRPGLSP